MKKLIALLLVMSMVMAFAACAPTTNDPSTEPSTEATTPTTEAPETTEATQPSEEATEPSGEGITAMTHEQFMAADLDSPVRVITYVQATQSWWDNKITTYCQSEDGAYFIYEMACPEGDAAKLVPGTKIVVTGYKAEWSGEIEIVDATFQILEGDPYIPEALDVTSMIGTDELLAHQNEKVAFKGMTVDSIEYKNGEPGDDIYVTLSKDGTAVSFCVEFYLTGTDSEVYKTVGTLKAGDTVDVEAFLYWYEGANPHITAITVA